MTNGLTIQQAAEVAHVSTETIRYWIKTGRIKPVPAIAASKRTGRPWGVRIPRDQLYSAMPLTRERRLKEESPENLLTIKDICRLLNINPNLAYSLVRRFDLEKTRVDGWTFLVSGDKLYQALQEDPYYWYLVYNTPENSLLTD